MDQSGSPTDFSLLLARCQALQVEPLGLLDHTNTQEPTKGKLLLHLTVHS